MDLVDRIK